MTGANSGIGFQTSRLLARNNAHVVMVVRDLDKGKKYVQGHEEEAMLGVARGARTGTISTAGRVMENKGEQYSGVRTQYGMKEVRRKETGGLV